jgi:hypothetical protein
MGVLYGPWSGNRTKFESPTETNHRTILMRVTGRMDRGHSTQWQLTQGRTSKGRFEFKYKARKQDHKSRSFNRAVSCSVHDCVPPACLLAPPAALSCSCARCSSSVPASWARATSATFPATAAASGGTPGGCLWPRFPARPAMLASRAQGPTASSPCTNHRPALEGAVSQPRDGPRPGLPDWTV